MFLTGLFCMIATGIAWIVIGGITSFSARHRVEQSMIQFFSAAVVALISLALQPGEILNRDFGQSIVFGLLLASGALNYLSFVFLTQAMRFLHNALAWAIMQSAMIFPFLLGIWGFQVPASSSRIAGMLIILLALAGLTYDALKTQPQNSTGQKNSIIRGLLWNAAAWISAGLCQICANLPSYWTPNAAISPVAKTFGMMLGTIAIFLVVHGRQLAVKRYYRGMWPPALMLAGVLILVEYCFFFRGLDLLAQAQAGSIGYPVAIGVCIGGFALYSGIILREKFRPLTIFALGGNLLGILLLSS